MKVLIISFTLGVNPFSHSIMFQFSKTVSLFEVI